MKAKDPELKRLEAEFERDPDFTLRARIEKLADSFGDNRHRRWAGRNVARRLRELLKEGAWMEFLIQGTQLRVHACRHGWCPGPEKAHRVGRPCPLYGEKIGHWFVARWWTPIPAPDWRALPGFDVSMVLPLESP